MDWYYGIFFLVAAFLQQQLEGFVTAFSCSVIAFFGEQAIRYLVIEGFHLFMAAGVLDLILLFIACSFIKTKIGTILFFTSFLSCMVNVLFYCSYSPSGLQFYHDIRPYYSTINALLFEVLLYTCLVQSRLYPLLKKKFPIKKDLNWLLETDKWRR